MMHLTILLLALGLAVCLRLSWKVFPGTSVEDGVRAVVLLVVPSLFVLMMALSIIWMGPSSDVMPFWQGMLSHLLSMAFIGYALWQAGMIWFRNYRVTRYLKSLPMSSFVGASFRLLDTSELFIAQCGIFQTELVISRGLLGTCSPEQIEAMVAHEQAHLLYKDVLYTALVRWMKDLLPFFPASEELWKYVVLMRELRADRWASQTVDPLVLAESLLEVAQHPSPALMNDCVALSGQDALHGLDLRVQALLNPSLIPQKMSWHGLWLWIGVACCPLLIIPFHH